ncbi:MAG TPA: hypothetical protein VLA89_04455, partial [Gemmatimonadales bacterium]|nr:hypothetical protein [Gemmatimonadales bacterium]
MTTYQIQSPSDREWARRLESLLGDTTKLRVGEHPLAPGLAALRRLERGDWLQPAEKLHIADLVAYAKVLFQFESDWVGHRAQLLGDLRRADRCESLLFELNVG